jgi:hypothetical protein
MSKRVLWLVLWLAQCALSHAQAVVEAVQYPAWLERGGNAVPLAPGMALGPRDRLITGEDGRARLRLPEGSLVKLGENARFVVERVEERGGVLRGALTVLTGAFRYTSEKIGASRELALRVKGVSIGIRGTDLWGKGTEARDWVVLIEGRITVAADGHPPVALERPLDLYQKPLDAPPSLGRIDEAQLAAWSRETELSADGAAAVREGRWRVFVGKFESRDDARVLQRNVRAAGFPADIAGGRDNSPYIVQVAGFAGEAEARGAMARLRGVPGAGILTVSDAAAFSR